MASAVKQCDNCSGFKRNCQPWYRVGAVTSSIPINLLTRVPKMTHQCTTVTTHVLTVICTLCTRLHCGQGYTVHKATLGQGYYALPLTSLTPKYAHLTVVALDLELASFTGFIILGQD